MAAQNNAMADIIAGSVGNLSLHSADPGSNGSSELSGGNYARQAPTYDPASSGTADLSSSVEFGGPGTETDAAYLGFWSNDATPVWMGSVALSAIKTMTTNDTLTVTSAPVSAS